jgi:putative holliday junction resolvase
MRIMALDVGGRRIGVALSDERAIIASPLKTVSAEPRKQALEELARLVEEHQVGKLVVGLPLTLRGEVGAQAQLVQAFAKALGRRVPDVPIELFDERLTSVAAERSMVEAGVRADRRRRHIDEIAAVIILQDYLETQRGSPTLLPPDQDDDYDE